MWESDGAHRIESWDMGGSGRAIWLKDVTFTMSRWDDEWRFWFWLGIILAGLQDVLLYD